MCFLPYCCWHKKEVISCVQRSPQLKKEKLWKKWSKQWCPKWNAINLRITEKYKRREVQTTFCKKFDHISLKWSLLMLWNSRLCFFPSRSAQVELWAIIVNYWRQSYEDFVSLSAVDTLHIVLINWINLIWVCFELICIINVLEKLSTTFAVATCFCVMFDCDKSESCFTGNIVFQVKYLQQLKIGLLWINYCWIKLMSKF